MAIPTWPRNVSATPQEAEYSEEFAPLIVKTQMNFGNWRQRAVRSEPSDTRPFRIIVGQTHKTQVIKFLKNEIGNGTAVFRMEVLNDFGDLAWHRVQIADGKVKWTPVGWDRHPVRKRQVEKLWAGDFSLIVLSELPRNEN